MYESLPLISDFAEWVQGHPRGAALLAGGAILSVMGIRNFQKASKEFDAKLHLLGTPDSLPRLGAVRRQKYTRRDGQVGSRPRHPHHQVNRHRRQK